MKKTFAFVAVLLTVILATGSCASQSSLENRDYAYEAYCDSIYQANPDYYNDVLVETDEYCIYLEKHGKWW